MKKSHYIIVLVFLLFSCSKTPSDQIINYTEQKYGKNFKEGEIDLSKIFNFEWKILYIFPNWTSPEDVEKEIGFKYDGSIVKDDNYLFLFVDDKKIVKKFTYSNIKIGFSDNKNMGVYKINFTDAKYRINNNYWLYKK